MRLRLMSSGRWLCASLSLFSGFMCCRLAAQEHHEELRGASVTAFRLSSGPGMKVTVFDSLALRENISVSLSDLLAYNSAVFVKQSGRSSLSTVSFRGTSSSHTQVLWNGMKINSPMLGMTDFSMIPSFLTDGVRLLHGTSSLNAVSGGMGGAVELVTGAKPGKGFSMQYVQGFGSYVTADEYLRISYGGRRFSSSTRLAVSSSRNDFRYVNTDKNENVYDGDMNIIATRHPVERNVNGAWLDMHLLQDVRYDTDAGDAFVLSVWLLRSRRELPRLSVDYGEPVDFINGQRESTLRSVLSWSRSWGSVSSAEVSAGYAWTGLDYDYARANGNAGMNYMTKSRSRTGTVFLRGRHTRNFGEKWRLKTDLTLNGHHVRSADEMVMTPSGEGLGYEASRIEASAAVSLRWRPVRPLSVVLSAREELYGDSFSPLLPALSLDFLVSPGGNLHLKASASRNCRYPTLNDWYFLPGGNPDLEPETGFFYDVGYSFSIGLSDAKMSLSGEGSWFDSYVDNWILWLPDGARKNFYRPVNLMKVHAYGVEQTLRMDWRFARDWRLSVDGSFTWSPSVNCGEPMSIRDDSVGKQLVYVPEYSASVVGALSFRSWSLLYKWCWYSDRYTMSSNDVSISGVVPDYFMSDLTVSRRLSFRWADMSVSIAVKNLFDEDYVSVLSHPMPGINFEAFVGITPKFGFRRR